MVEFLKKTLEENRKIVAKVDIKLNNAINKIKPDKVIIEKEEDKRFTKKYGIEKSELDIISKKLLT